MKPLTSKALVATLLFLTALSVKGQIVTEIVSDFQGYWKSGIRPNLNPVAPNNSHNLLAFTYNGTRYSTGVNDATLTANSLTFTAGKYKALPVSVIAAPTTSTYIGLGQLYDGVAGGSTPPPANNIPFYLTDGINGLNLGTAVYNMPASNLIFDIGLFNIARIGDGIPDIIVTQVGEILPGVKDTLKFIDPLGNVVGNALAVTFAGADSLALIDNDFYNAWQNPMGFTSGFYPSNTKRAVRLFAFELSEFGLNSSNFASIDKFVHRLSGQSDQAFVAYNTNTVQILPNSNPGCFASLPGLWLKGNDGTSTITNNQKLASWNDRSPNEFTMEQAIVANEPQYKDATNAFNYNAYLNFDAGNRLLSANSPFTAADNNADIFIVGRPTNSTAGKNKILGFSRNATDATGTGSGDFPAISYDQLGRLSIDSGNVNLVTSTANLNTIVLQQINYTQGPGGSISLSTNGAADGSAAVSKHLGLWTTQMGDMSPGNDLSDFDVAEVIVFPTNLTADERIKIETYLNIKYGITSAHDYVSSGGATVWSLSSNSGYNNSIFGIGREDCQAMHRKQSRSVTADSLVTIGNTSIAIDNTSNFNLMNNGAYSIMGNNAGALTLQATETPASCYQRIGREWKVRETGTVGSLQLRVPASTSTSLIKLPAASNNNMYMLVDNDGNFSTGIIDIIPMTLNGTNWECSYNFSDGNYYTFATDNGLNTDQNDLPVSWPAASAVINGCNTDGDGRVSLSDMNGSRVMAWAGAGITAEAIASTNATASADGDDDGLQSPAIVSRYYTNVFTILLNGNVANTTIYYRMWIDWNADGNFANDFDRNNVASTYAGSDVITGAGPKSVNVNVLTPYAASSNFAIRLIVSTSAIPNNYASNSSFVYTITNGEIEDYFFAASVLPVTLERFGFVVKDCDIVFDWRTASETNSKEYILERSTDGTHFVTVVTIPSANAANGASYSYTDAGISTGSYFYRLRMVDIDGRIEYSNTNHVNVNCSSVQISIAPNPVLDQLIIKGTNGKETITITDLAGRVVRRQNAVPVMQTIDVSKLAGGVYVVNVSEGATILHREKIIKMNMP